jgi:hypothetical protein
MIPFRKSLLFVSALTACVLSFADEVDDVIAKARGHLGVDAALAAVKSIHFTGTMEAGTRKAAIDIIFQKPCQQRLFLADDQQTEEVGLDTYSAWQRASSVKDPGRERVTLFPVPVLKIHRANTFEAINFFNRAELNGGTTSLLSRNPVDGRPAVQLAFRYGDNIVFARSFDAETGRLLLTEASNGARIREEGEQFVDGIRFPQRIITDIKVRNDKGEVIDSRSIITIEKITLNEVFPDSLFAMPMPRPRSGR